MSDEFGKETEQKVYSLDIPQREGKDGFIGTHFTLMLQMGSLLRSIETPTDERIAFMANLLISFVPGEKERLKIRTAIKKDIEERQKTATTNEEKGRISLMCWIEGVGSVMDYIDQHVGISKENKIGFSIPRRNK